MRSDSNLKSAISEHKLWIKFMSTSCEIALRYMPQKTFDEIGLGNGLVLAGNKPWPEALLTQIHFAV